MPPTTLKPCPFCGGEPTVLPATHERGPQLWCRIKCENIDCDVQPSADSSEEFYEPRTQEYFEALAAERWNTRAGSTEHDLRLEIYSLSMDLDALARENYRLSIDIDFLEDELGRLKQL